jgi:thiamine transporter ThiT
VHEHNFLALATSTAVVRRAFKVAVVVGTLLALINHADAFVNGSFDTKNMVQIVLTYLVPYGVATYSAVHALRDNLKKTQ